MRSLRRSCLDRLLVGLDTPQRPSDLDNRTNPGLTPHCPSHELHPGVAAVRSVGYAAAMGAFPVSPEKEAQLGLRMNALGVREADIDENFVRSGGHGGQNVNKTSTCVMLRHRPTGLQVKCQSTRQQGLNRFIARRLLLDKIEMLRKGYVDAQRDRVEKIRRQKRRRSRRARERMLADKSIHSEKKEARRRIGPE